jgi:hypothetical protein
VTDPDTPVPFEPPELFCRHWIGCRTFWQQPNSDDPDGGYFYSLGSLIISVWPPGGEMPFYLPRIFFYAQLTGTPGEYTVRIRMVRVTIDDIGEEKETPTEEFGPWDIPVTGDRFAESYGFPLRNVPFNEAGVYEFQLWIDEFEDPLARERIEVRG